MDDEDTMSIGGDEEAQETYVDGNPLEEGEHVNMEEKEHSQNLGNVPNIAKRDEEERELESIIGEEIDQEEYNDVEEENARTIKGNK